MAFCAKHNPDCRAWRQKLDQEERKHFQFLRWFFGVCLRNEVLRFLHGLSRVFLHAYLGFVIIGFFFQQSLPKLFIDITDAFAGTYMGVLGIYFLVREVMRREGKTIPRSAGESFFIVWVVLLLVSSGLTFFSPDFHFSKMYSLILKNSFASIIFRIGMFLR